MSSTAPRIECSLNFVCEQAMAFDMLWGKPNIWDETYVPPPSYSKIPTRPQSFPKVNSRGTQTVAASNQRPTNSAVSSNLANVQIIQCYFVASVMVSTRNIILSTVFIPILSRASKTLQEHEMNTTCGQDCSISACRHVSA